MAQSAATLIRFEEKYIPEPNSGCWLWEGSCTPTGYGRFSVEGKAEPAHRVAYKLYKGDPGSLHVLHKCDNPCCVNPDHLFLGTHAENMRDMCAKGRLKTFSGEQHGCAKLTEEQVHHIKYLLATSDFLQRDIAAMYNVTPPIITYIKQGRLWGWV